MYYLIKAAVAYVIYSLTQAITKWLLSIDAVATKTRPRPTATQSKNINLKIIHGH